MIPTGSSCLDFLGMRKLQILRGSLLVLPLALLLLYSAYLLIRYVGVSDFVQYYCLITLPKLPAFELHDLS